MWNYFLIKKLSTHDPHTAVLEVLAPEYRRPELRSCDSPEVVLGVDVAGGLNR